MRCFVFTWHKANASTKKGSILTLELALVFILGSRTFLQWHKSCACACRYSENKALVCFSKINKSLFNILCMSFPWFLSHFSLLFYYMLLKKRTESFDQNEFVWFPVDLTGVRKKRFFFFLTPILTFSVMILTPNVPGFFFAFVFVVCFFLTWTRNDPPVLFCRDLEITTKYWLCRSNKCCID